MPTSSELTNDASTVGLWHMNGTVGSAGKKADVLGSNNLVENGTVTATSGFDSAANGAYTYTGPTNYLSIADFAGGSYDASNNVTVELWYKPGSVSGVQTIISKWANTTDQEWILYQNGTSLVVGLLGNGAVCTASSALSSGTLYYIAFTMNTSKQAELFINGVSAATGSTASSVSGTGSEIRIGQNSSTNGATLTQVDELRISNIVRTSTEISNYYNGMPVARSLASLGVG